MSPATADPELQDLGSPAAGDTDGAEETPQGSWSQARELLSHLPPGFDDARFHGGMAGRDQTTVSGNTFRGDSVIGIKVENAQFGTGAPVHGSGLVPEEELDTLADVFQPGENFAEALTRLRRERVLILSGRPRSGRRAAALMLLHALDIRRIRLLDPYVDPAELMSQAKSARGYVLCDLALGHGRPLHQAHLLKAHERLLGDDGYLVVTVDDRALESGIRPVPWAPPEPAVLLRTHLRRLLGDHPADLTGLLELDEATALLKTVPSPREVAAFAERLARHGRGELSRDELGRLGQDAVDAQAAAWLSDTTTPLADKAFLLATSVFDGAAHAYAVEHGDTLHRRLQQTEAPRREARIRLFADRPEQRLQGIRAALVEEDVESAWGLVRQQVVRFGDSRTATSVLREAWLGHPSSRTALAAWLTVLANSTDPVVRTRAAAAAALLAESDLAGAMNRLLLPWARDRRFRLRLQAGTALALIRRTDASGAVPRILHEWSRSEDHRLRWSAVRAYPLLLDEAVVGALDDFADIAARAAAGTDRPDAAVAATEREALTESCALLLLLGPATRSVALDRLGSWWQQEAGPLRTLSLDAFLVAAAADEGRGTGSGWPPLLRWFAEDTATGAEPGERARLVFLWRQALAVRPQGDTARDTLGDWIHRSAHDPEAELALAALLRGVAGTEAEQQRLSHLLRRLRVPGRTDPLPVAQRLLRALSLPVPPDTRR
ncbi:hypothetical protein [Streptacidiphilus jiangxiensis]|uniref:Uncharacterized protein n=1 Tax=Streptacidiphilus jiangxiensis TaxID=235985 RepID=A0A1H7M495_STRJI|nr:hypothetical protein [Streptacidiphilus jiangxiensis]SEL05932.1 hypothetical protein SAMN05414137_105166 [Streptacidiphilus jiangxiensis]